MARRGRRRRDDDDAERDDFSIANLLAPLSISYSPPLTVYEDRREFHPERDLRPARSFSKRSYSDVVSEPVRSKPRALLSPDTFKFAVPKKVLVCVRRQQRREVLHALKLTRRRGGAGARRRNYWSAVSCK